MTSMPNVVDRETWLGARRSLLVEEKALTRQLDRLAERRRTLPWVAINKSYTFETVEGPRTLDGLFAGRDQLIVYHFMMGPDWTEGCQSCSFWADNFNGTDIHLANRDTTFIAVSRAPLAAITAYQARMGWDFAWISSSGSDFNMDFAVSNPEGYRIGRTYNFEPVDDPMEEAHGLSVFTRNAEGQVFHTYSSYARGVEIFNGAYQLLDLTPLGRAEHDLPGTMAWLRRHDEYEQ